MNAPAPSDLMARSLLRIHEALRRTLDTIVRVSAAPVPEGDRAAFADFCGRFTRFLRVHHDSEEEIIFPKVTEVSERASLPAYASNVTSWRADHKKLLGGLSAFETATAQFRTGGSPETLLRADEVRALDVASAEHGQRVGGPQVLMLLVHALTDDEQKAQFSEMPWIVRKVLLKRIWARGFRGCLKYAHNPSISL